MRTGLLTVGLIASALYCTACNDSSKADAEETPPGPVATLPPPVELPPGDPRNEVIQAAGYANHGEAKGLGIAKFGGAMVDVTQFGPIMEGGEAHFMVDVGRTEVSGVYVWIGKEDDGKKRRWPATPEPEGYHVHCGVPRPLKDDHELWVEIQLPSGERHHGSYYIGGQ